MANSSDTFLLLRASSLGLSPWAVVLLYALFNLTYAGVSYPAGVLSDGFGRWRVIGLGWAIYAVTYVGFALLQPSTSWALWPLMAAYGVYMGLTDGVAKALIADYAPASRRGTAMALFYATTGLTALGASLIAGLAWDRAGPALTFGIGASFAIVASLALPIARAVAVARA
jgi:MFS family permease